MATGFKVVLYLLIFRAFTYIHYLESSLLKF